MSRKSDPWIRRFEVSDPCLHTKGYTIYKITSTVFPKNFPEAATEVVVWKRFSDIKRLHKVLKMYHANLHLKGEFPSFPKDKLFGRFEASVIEERRQSALKLLEFVALHPPLFTSQLFVNFFEAGKQPLVQNETKIEDKSEPIQPVKFYDHSPSVEQEAREPIIREESTLSGIWQYRQTNDEISLDSNEESDDQEEPKENDLLTRSTMPIDLGGFDPYSTPQLEATTPQETKIVSNAWLLSAFDNCSSLEDNEKTSNTGLLFPQAFADYEETDIASRINVEEKSPENDVNSAPPSHPDTKKIPNNQNRSVTSELNISEEGKICRDDYNIVARELLSTAKLYETSGDFHTAFDLYKRVIETLLNGLKEETDPVKIGKSRREIARYLSHAERIYEKYLSNKNSSGDFRSDIYSKSIDHTNLYEQQLGRYKVLGIINKVLLVLDCVTNSTYVIKVLTKAVRSLNVNGQSNVPLRLNHMVQLVRYHETEDSIFLVLQYASGGRLWNFVGCYLQRGGSQLLNDVSNLEGDFEDESTTSNIYGGKKLSCASENVTIPSDGCPPNYAKLFKDYVSLTSLENGLIRLDDNQRVVYSKQSESPVIEFKRQGDDKDTSVHNNKIQPSEEEISSDLFYGEIVDDPVSLTNLKNVDTGQLLSNAQKLMENVEETLRVSDKISNGSYEYVTSLTAVSPTENNPKLPPSSTTNARLPRTRPRNRKSSEGDPFSMDRSPSVVRETSGSVELQRSKIKHFSSMFQQFDDINSQTASLPENYIITWASEIIMCVSDLHKVGIVCRDLKPDNILLDDKGHVFLTYFSQWSTVDSDIDQAAKSNLYSAPEVGGIDPVSSSCDWWSVGALLFELITGKTLVSYHQGGFNSHTQLHIPIKVSKEAESLLKGFLCYNPNERLGSGPLGVENIKAHPFFLEVDWN